MGRRAGGVWKGFGAVALGGGLMAFWAPPAQAQRFLCGGAVSVDSATPSAAARGEMALVLRNRAPWAIRYRPAAPAAPQGFPSRDLASPPGLPPPAPRDLPATLPGGRALPPGLPFEVPPELLTGRLGGGGGGAATPPPDPGPLPRPAPVPWRWLLPGDATTLWVEAATPGEAVARLGLLCDAGPDAPAGPLAPGAAPR